MKTTKNYFNILQVYRGVAALLVVLHHTIPSINYYHSYDNFFLDSIGRVGKFGVDFFFVLSGFIISFTSISKVKNKNNIWNYLKNRILRIYIPYLPIGIFIYLLYLMLPDFSNSDREISIITTFTLFPDGKPALSVAWTLTFELIFYLFYTLRFFGKQFFRIMLLFWIIIILIKNIFFGEFVFELNIFKTLTSLYNLEFFFGILLVYVYSKKIQIKNWISVMAIFLFGILFLVMIILKFDFFNFSINIAFVSFIFFFIYLTITKFNDTKNSNLFVGIGAASYSIYLIHNNLQTIIVRYFPKIMIEIRILLIILTSLLFSIIIGYVYYFIFEKRITNYFKKIIN